MTVILDNSQGINSENRCSPDKSLEEYKYTRRVVKAISEELQKQGVKVHILVPEEYNVSVSERVRRTNEIYSKDKGSFLVSCHVNKSGIGADWKNARGWSVFVCNNAVKDSLRLANDLYDAAEDSNLYCKKPYSTQKYWRQNLYLCQQTKCPAVITQNLFQDNKEDVNFLNSECGFNTVVNLHVKAITAYISGK